MGKHKDGKNHKKGSQFVIRVDKAERDAFVSLCDTLDTSAAREIRRFMRDWVAANTPKPADVQEDSGASAVTLEAASALAVTDIATVQAEEIGSEAAGPIIATEPNAGEPGEVKPRRKSARRQ
ncbi:MAG: hypothetical protein RLZZ09_3462 [Pseudomonadota bacterium]